jgi:hypothetical protein
MMADYELKLLGNLFFCPDSSYSFEHLRILLTSQSTKKRLVDAGQLQLDIGKTQSTPKEP